VNEFDLSGCDPERIMAAFSCKGAHMTYVVTTELKDRSLLEAKALVRQRETEGIMAENALAIAEQMQAEGHRQHMRALEIRRMDQEHELAKMGAIDLDRESEQQFKLAMAKLEAEMVRRSAFMQGFRSGILHSSLVIAITITAMLVWGWI